VFVVGDKRISSANGDWAYLMVNVAVQEEDTLGVNHLSIAAMDLQFTSFELTPNAYNLPGRVGQVMVIVSAHEIARVIAVQNHAGEPDVGLEVLDELNNLGLESRQLRAATRNLSRKAWAQQPKVDGIAMTI
jgi:hypothetical protein